VALACAWGQVTGQVTPAAVQAGTHLSCFCADCRTAERHLGQPDPGTDGVDLLMLAPDRLRFVSGVQHLAVMRLSPKGPLRWYAACCNAPICNTLGTRSVHFASVLAARLEGGTDLGPALNANVPKPNGGSRTQGQVGLILRLLIDTVAARLSGRMRKNPFFDPDTGAPIRPVTLLSKAQRAAATPS